MLDFRTYFRADVRAEYSAAFPPNFRYFLDKISTIFRYTFPDKAFALFPAMMCLAAKYNLAKTSKRCTFGIVGQNWCNKRPFGLKNGPKSLHVDGKIAGNKN